MPLTRGVSSILAAASLGHWTRSCSACSFDLVILSNDFGWYAGYSGSNSGDKIGRPPWGDPIFGMQDSDSQESEPFIVRALRVVRTLLDAPQFLSSLRIPN